MPTPTELIELRQNDIYSNYYAIAFDLKISGCLPVDPYFPSYRLSIYDRLVIAKEGCSGTVFRGIDLPSSVLPFEMMLRSGQIDDERFLNLSETIHFDVDFVQQYFTNLFPVLFPTNQQSERFSSILLSSYDIETITESPTLQKTLIINFVIAMKIYGFSVSVEVTTDENGQKTCSLPSEHCVKMNIYSKRKPKWLVPNSIHYAYFTRILHCLHLLGLDNYADVFKKMLIAMRADYSADISPVFVTRWEEVTSMPMYGSSVRTNTESTDDPMQSIFQDVWKNIVTQLQGYAQKLLDSSPLGIFHVYRSLQKWEAVFLLTKVLCNFPSNLVRPSDVLTMNIDSHFPDEVDIIKRRLCHAGAIARGYISEFPEVTAGWQSRLYDLLKQIIEIQRQCVRGEIPRLSLAMRNAS